MNGMPDRILGVEWLIETFCKPRTVSREAYPAVGTGTSVGD